MSPIPFYVAGLLVFGCLNTLTTKIQWTMYSVGTDGVPRKFEKPWFAVLLMFLAMSVVGLAHAFRALRSKKASAQALPDMTPGGVGKERAPEQSQCKIFLVVGIPAILDLVATGVGFLGFVYIPSSTYQMLRGSMIIFTAVESVFLLGRRLQAYNWIGVAVCVLGVSMVGLSNSLSSQSTSDASEPSEDGGLVVFGVSMVLLAQLFQATQVIVEELMLKGMSVPPMLLVSYEGIWGSVGMIGCVLPLLSYLPGHDHGSQEDFGDTLLMLKNSSQLQALIALYLFSCSTYNISGMQVTGALSGVHRTMLEASRTLVIWMLDLFVHYVVDKQIAFGESWSVYSWLQLAGFAVLISGQAIYGGIIRLPCLTYDLAALPENPASPAAMQVMSPGLPPAPLVPGTEVLLTEDGEDL
eukprot:CAMPEP_0171063782 /NCGR_PEP_ID=MMETSP0766_2-20121228/5885_1 /TAXON_ID=439317 /ORGANISM="Gambierdiscus australes, Strain CAWD 149" /LENGTH=410 /DNA_ID=CAMNT_0011519743 /DNA_START=52 /DNA_END=1284 /DNA_ORIENTATION=+